MDSKLLSQPYTVRLACSAACDLEGHFCGGMQCERSFGCVMPRNAMQFMLKATFPFKHAHGAASQYVVDLYLLLMQHQNSGKSLQMRCKDV
jgi:hypothetical protein